MKKILFAILVILFLISVFIIMIDENRIISLENKLAKIEEDVNLVKKEITERNVPPVNYPLDERTAKVIGLGLNRGLDFFNMIYESIWEDMFFWSTFFESIDGYNQTIPSGGSITNNSEQLILSTGATANNEVRIYKQPEWQGVLTFYKKNAFRTNIVLNSVSNLESWLTVGPSNNSSFSFYGFKIVNNTLKGVSCDGGGTIQEINLMTISSSTSYNLEARYYPNEKIVFYVKGPNDSIGFRPAGVITSHLPKAAQAPFYMIIDVRIKTTDANNKTLSMSFWEFMQSREYNKIRR